MSCLFKKSLCVSVLLGACSFFASVQAWAQFRVEVDGVGMSQIPIGVDRFRGEGDVSQRVADVISQDLLRSGQFKPQQVTQELDENSRPDFHISTQKTLDALVCGSIEQTSAHQFVVNFRLWDVVNREDLGAKSFTVDEVDLRLAAHRISDFVYESLTGERGVFSTRIAYVTKLGTKYDLWIADIDGENAKSAMSSPEPIISPAWSPDGIHVAYVSFEDRKPVVYVHDITKGTRRVVANFKGSNSAPAWSPDGKRLVLALSQGGTQQLYTVNVQGGELQLVKKSLGIDTEPLYAPDGKSIFFVSDQAGGPQIYRLTLATGEVSRVTFKGSYNISPSVSADGKLLTYISRVNDGYKLQLQDLQTGSVSELTSTLADERPSFAPNGRLIVYATRVQGRDSLMTTSLDGRVKTKLAIQQGDMREPTWGPFQAAH